MHQELCSLMCEQVNNELASSLLYMNLAGYFDSISLSGFGHWFRKQADEEHGHAMKFFDHIIERRERPVIGTVPKFEVPGKSPLKIFGGVLEHERKVTEQIHNLYELAEKQHDHASCVFLQWFITEQVEELNSVESIIDRLSHFGEEGAGLYLMDSELHSRT